MRDCENCGEATRAVYPILLDKARTPDRIDSLIPASALNDGSQPVYVDRPPPYDYMIVGDCCVGFFR